LYKHATTFGTPRRAGLKKPKSSLPYHKEKAYQEWGQAEADKAWAKALGKEVAVVKIGQPKHIKQFGAGRGHVNRTGMQEVSHYLWPLRR
jgi:hypothetical protein